MQYTFWMSLPSGFVVEPVHVPPAYEYIVARVRSAIWSGELIPGERLPSERSLAEGCAVSRLTIREALRTLQGEGLITVKRGSAGGAIVSASETTAAQRHRLVVESREALRDAHEVREGVEPIAARLAAQRIDGEHAERLAACHADLLDSADVPSFRRADSGFHLTIATSTQNALLADVVRDARARLFMTFDVQEFKVLKSTTVEAHAAILAAIEGRDGDRAARLMAAHLEEAWQEVVSVLDTPVGRGSRFSSSAALPSAAAGA